MTAHHGAAPADALCFAAVAEAYERARPSYPADAAAWLVGDRRANVVELGAGTGKLTELLVAAGHDVVATDPVPEMLGILRERVPDARAAIASAEHIPVASHSADVVVCAQSFHWFDHAVALPEIARVLRPGGSLALVWNVRDDRIPWVRRLGTLLDGHRFRASGAVSSLTLPAEESEHFGWVEPQEFRFWQSLGRGDLLDLVRSRAFVAVLEEGTRADLLRRVGELYDEYGRGPDGMRLPYLTRCHKAVVRHQDPTPPVPEAWPADRAAAHGSGAARPTVPEQPLPVDDPGTVLIDFK